MKKKKVLKSMARFKVIVRETLLNNLPPVVLFDLYELNEEQINYLYQRVNEVYDIDTNKDEELDSFYIPEKDRRLKGYNLNFLFQKLADAKESINDQEYENIREEIIALNINLVKNSIKFLFKDIPLPKEDAMMIGVEALLAAIDFYQGKSQATFYAYAISKIVLKIQHHFKELIGVTYEEYKQGANNLVIPVSVMIIDEPPIITGDLMNPEDNQMPVSFEDYEEVDALEDEELNEYGTEEFNYDNKELREILDQVLATLKPVDNRALKLYYGLDGNEQMTCTKIAEIENRSITLIGQRITRGLRMMRHPLRKKQIRDFIEEDYYSEWQKEKAKQIEQQTIMCTRICELLFHNISAGAFPNFMRMAGFELTPEEIVQLVAGIEKMCNLTNENSLDSSRLCDKSEKIIKNDQIREKVCQIICQSQMYYTWIKVGIRQFNDNIYKLYESNEDHEVAEKLRLQQKEERQEELRRVSYYGKYYN